MPRATAYIYKLISTLHTPLSTPSASQSRGGDAYQTPREGHGQLFDLNLNFKTPPSLHFFII